MIAYAIEAARDSQCFEHIIVSTDDAEIAAVSVAYGAEVPFVRPADLADDHTPTVPVIAQAIEACQALGWDIAYACCIYPCVPLIDPVDLKRGFDQLLAAPKALYSFPVTSFPSPVQAALRRSTTGMVDLFDPSHVATRTQDLEPGFYDAGQFYWGGADAWLSGEQILSHGTSIELPEWRVVDIDTIADWTRAELMFQALRSHRPP